MAEKHHAKRRSCEIKTRISEGQRVRARLLRGKIPQARFLRSSFCDLQKVCAQIKSRDLPLCSHPHGEANGGLARAAGQVQHPHAGPRLRIVHERLCHSFAHRSRLRLPLLGGDEAVLASPSWFLFGRHCHTNNFPETEAATLSCDESPRRLACAEPSCSCSWARSLPLPLPWPWPSTPRARGVSRSSTSAPDRRTCAPSQKTHALQSRDNRAVSIPPACSPRRAPAAHPPSSTVVPLHRRWPAPAADLCRCTTRNSR